MNATDVDMRKVNRIEVIDEDGRSYVNWQTKALGIEMSLQDEGRTIKVFTKGRSNVAAAKEEQAKVLTRDEVLRMYDTVSPNDHADPREHLVNLFMVNGYLAPTTGIDVEAVMKIVEPWLDDCVDVRSLRKALEAHTGGGNLRTDPWISVEDRLPDIDIEMHGAMVSGQFIAMMDDGVVAVMQCQRRMDDGSVEWVDGVDVLDGVTHWMPIPSPPDTDKG